MPLPWKTILTNVPWSDVLGKAPKIADGARNLWERMGRKSADAPDTDPMAEAVATPDGDLSTRLAALEAANRQLHARLLAAGELVRALGEQNIQLVAQIDAQRRRTHRQAWALAATALVAGLALLLAGQPHFTEFFA